MIPTVNEMGLPQRFALAHPLTDGVEPFRKEHVPHRAARDLQRRDHRDAAGQQGSQGAGETRHRVAVEDLADDRDLELVAVHETMAPRCALPEHEPDHGDDERIGNAVLN